MDCPFCAEEIKDEAIFCRYCAHDLTIPKPLMEKVAALSQRIELLESQLEKQESELHRWSSEPGSAGHKHRSAGGLKTAFSSLALATLFVTISHFLLIYQLEASRTAVQLTALSVSFMFGYFLFKRASLGPAYGMMFGVLLGIVSFVSTSIVVWLLDGDPILPTSPIKLQLSIEFIVAITFGAICGNAFASVTDPPGSDLVGPNRLYAGLAKNLLSLIGYDHRKQQFSSRLESIERVAKTGTAVVTALGALAVGLRHY